MGSEEFIRLQFEEYLLSLLSCMKYHDELNSYNAGESGRRSQAQLQAFNIEGDPALEFNQEFLGKWRDTANNALFQRLTSEALLYSIVEPRHPCTGGLMIDDIQRRLTQQISELHLDDRVREGREALNKHLTTGQKKVSAAFNSFWSDIEAMREAQRKRNEDKAAQSPSRRPSEDKEYGSPLATSDDVTPVPSKVASTPQMLNRRTPSMELTNSQASVSAVGQKASAYFNSWASWAGEKRKEWQEKKNTPTSTPPSTSPSAPTFVDAGEASAWDPDELQTTPRESEDSVRRSQSMSRRKRWSNRILRRTSGDFASQGQQSSQITEDGKKTDILPTEAARQELNDTVVEEGGLEHSSDKFPIGSDEKAENEPPTKQLTAQETSKSASDL